MRLNREEDLGARWMQYMRSGMFEEAWKISDKVLSQRASQNQRHLPRHQQAVWDGTSLAGKRVLIRCYHGLGDTIQFIRYVPMVKAIAKEVIVWAQPELISLLCTIKEIDKLLPLHDGDIEAAYDIDVEIMELPFIFRTTVDNIPSNVPYLHASPGCLGVTDNSISAGLVWKAGGWDTRRDIPFEYLAPLFEVNGVNLYILQYNAPLAGWHEGSGIWLGNQSMAEYASMISGLDLMISVDSMPVHLAGALGVPVWNLLHADSDWRWMSHINYSPWYPTMRLFRQEKQGDWRTVISSVAAQLQSRADYGGNQLGKAS